MGCHTWFSRPVTEEELAVFKSHAIEDAYNLWGDTEENKEFKYTWADGTSATGIVNKKHKPTKLVYANSAGEPINGKATKGYEMQLPTNDKTVDLPYGVYQSWDIMLQLFRQKISVPEIGQLCAVYFNETYKSYRSCRN